MGNKMCCTSSGPVVKSIMSNKIMMTHHFRDFTVQLSYGSLTNEDVDAIVVVANSKLKLNPNTLKNLKTQSWGSIQDELNKILHKEGGRLDHGSVVYTHSGDVHESIYIS